MRRPPNPESVEKTDAFRRLVETEGIAALAAALDDAFDNRAGPDRALTVAERFDRLVCRERFGHYDPCSVRQRRFLTDLAADAGQLLAA